MLACSSRKLEVKIMINLPSVFVANGAALLLLIITMIGSRRTLNHNTTENSIFNIMMISNALQCAVETATFCIDGSMAPGMHTLSLVLNAFIFINTGFFAYVWTIYADYKLFSDIKRIHRIYPFVGIPFFLICAAGVVNLITPVFFDVSDQNVYSRTPLFAITYILSYAYMAYGVVLIYRFRKKTHKYLFVPAILFMIPIVICSVLQFFFYGMSFVWLGVAISLVSLYLNIQNEASYIDSVSGLFTRQYLNRYLYMVTEHSCERKMVGGIMLDIDNFKGINDEYGHFVGDDAIASAGKILMESISSSSNCLAFRFAGDEFMIIQIINSADELKCTANEIKKNVDAFNGQGHSPYKIQFSFGFSVYDYKKDSINEFLRRMDTAMYAEKKSKQRMAVLSEQSTIE